MFLWGEMENLVADANLCFSVACEGDTGVQREHIAMEILIFQCTENAGFLMSGGQEQKDKVMHLKTPK